MPPLKRRMSSSCSKSRQSSYKFMQDDSTIKRYSHGKSSCKSDYKDLDDSYEESGSVENNKFLATKVLEKTFPGMIWDVGFVGEESIFVCHGEGVDICNSNLERLVRIEVRLPGGAVGLPNGNLIVIDRHSDSVNIYSPKGSMIRSFSGGNSPMAVAVDCELQQIFVTDICDKCVHKYSLSDGHLEGTIGSSSAENFKFQWPLYVVFNQNGEIMVSDTIKKQVASFSISGDFLTSTCLQVSDDNKRNVQPHGLAFIKNVGLMVVDSLVDSVELFDITGQVHVQTAISYIQDGYKPKVVGASSDGRFIVGGSGGLVKLYTLKPNDLYRPNQNPKKELKLKSEQLLKKKQKINEEFDTDWKNCKTKKVRQRQQSTNQLARIENCSESLGTVKQNIMGHFIEVSTLSTVTAANNTISSRPIESSLHSHEIGIETKLNFQNDDCIVIDDDDKDDVDNTEHSDCGESLNGSNGYSNPAYHEQCDETYSNDSDTGEGILISNVSSIKEVYKDSDNINDENVIILDY